MKESVSTSCGSRSRTTRFHRAMTVALLALTTLGAKAEDYVLMYGDYFLGQSTTATRDFVPNASIYTGSSGDTFRNANNYYIRYNSGLAFSTTNSTDWTINNNNLRYRTGGTYYYINLNNTTWRATNTTSNRATVYEVTEGSLSAGYTDFTISGDKYIAASGKKNYSHTNTVSQTACTTYTFNDLTYYSTDDSKAATTTKPGTEVTTGYTWSLSGANGYATVDDTGAITVSSIPDEDVVMTLTCTNNTAGKSASMTVTLTKNVPVAAGYVIYDGNNHYLGGTNTTAITSFNPNTCLWTLNSNKLRNGNNYYVRLNRSGYVNYTYSLNLANTDSHNTIALSGQESGETGQKINVAYDNNNSRYLRYNSGWTVTDDADNSGTDILFAVVKREFSLADATTAPTISAAINNAKTGIQLSHTNVNGTYAPAYTDYIFYNNTHHYWYNGASHATAPSAVDFSTTDATYRWSITNGGDYATIDATTGVLTSKGAATTQQTVTVTLTTTEANSGYSNTQTYEVKIQDHAATTVTAGIGDHDVISSVNGTLTLRGFISGSYTAAYTTYTFDNGSHNLYNGTDYGYNTPTINDANTCTYTWSLSGDGASYSQLSSATGQTPTLTYKSDAGHDVVVNANLTVTHSDFPEFSATADPFPITLYSATITAPTIDFTAETNIVTLSVPSEGTTYYTTDGSDPKTSDTKQSYDPASPIAVTTSPMVVKAYSERWGVESVESEETIRLKLGAPEISVADDGTVTITLANAPAGTELYYTIDGSEPSSTSSLYNSSSKPQVSNGTTVNVVAVKSGYDDSQVVSAVYAKSGVTSDGKVILNDYEDHNWTYYQKSENLPAGYPADYLTSPDPRNVVITYRGGSVSGASAVAISGLDGEGQNTIVYYKTLEKYDLSVRDEDNGEYAYTVISNPFSKRPRKTGATGTDGYYGFAGWKVVSGGEYIAEHSNNDVLALDETIHFTNLGSGYTPNCTSGEVVFEATWAPAQVKTGTSVPSFDSDYKTYETRFWVISGNITGNSALSIGTACTMMARNPDGTIGNYNTYTIQRAITAGTDNVKIEWVKFNSTGTVDANGKTFTVGRGVVQNGTGGPLYGINTDANCVNTVKIESGKYSLLHNFNSGISNGRSVDQLMILGCDYDRAKGENENLSITGEMYLGKSVNLHRTSGELFCRAVLKSGNFQPGVDAQGSDYTGVGGSHTYYMSVNGNAYPGRRYMLVEGGHHRGLNGGMDEATGQYTTDRAFDLRVRGTAQIDGVVYGCAEYANAKGTRTMIFTGGTINGWIAGGANGTRETNGQLSGATYLYVGGKTSVDSKHSTKVMNRSVGGNVYGAGCGYSGTSSSGEVTLGTNIVVADNAFVERGVYGGGGFGFCNEEKTSNIYIVGGHVGGYTGADYNGTTVQGGVYGGARQNNGGSSNIIMTGGLVEGGIYGGSNSSGTLSGSVTMKINGGQVGTSSSAANIHGGGYGASTTVSQNVDVTLGTRNASTGETAGTAVVYGDVYGGSALGNVNGTAANTNYHTNVTLNAGTINGSLYGGALGSSSVAANVYGPVAVKVYGGSVNTTTVAGSGAVYGCNNVNGAPQRSVAVDIYGTDPAPAEGQYALDAVYGGGNMADYAAGTPTVKVHNCDNSIGSVYGGGNAADITGTGHGTDVTIYGGDVIGNVFGGGNGEREGTEANVAGNVNVKIYGGTILNVFGGSNTRGTIGGTITVNIDSQGDTDSEGSADACTMNVGNVYGGGNRAASNVGTLNIGCTGTDGYIDAVYGGANAADITGNIALNITGGHIGNVFGGNNASGTISGKVDVTVGPSSESCGIQIGNVYGGGNEADMAQSANSVTVNINGDDDAEIGNVYGGGKLASVYSTNVYLRGGTITGNVFGGGKGSKETTELAGKQMILNGGTHVYAFGGEVANIFGGNDAGGTINGGLNVIIDKSHAAEVTAYNSYSGYGDLDITGDVYGGGNEAASAAGIVDIKCANAIANVFGGAKNANVTGDIVLTVGSGQIGNVYGGNNVGGTAGGDITVNVSKVTGDCGTGFTVGSVYGGGYGKNTNTGGDVTVNITDVTITGDVYGGSALGSVNASLSNATAVNLLGGSVAGNVYGGGLGDATTAALVKGNVTVTLGDDDGTSVIGGSIYGANNVNGTPLGTVSVVVNKTAPQDGAGTDDYDVAAVYGGGNKAAYVPDASIVATAAATVTVNNCDNSIEYVYGGGNAAPVPATNVTIWGGTYDYVFAGGNGAGEGNPGANVGYKTYADDADEDTKAAAAYGSGNATVNFYGGSVNHLFGGSNTKGNIKGLASVNIDEGGVCPLVKVDEAYAAGNEAYMEGGAKMNIGCVDLEFPVIYGGAKKADVGQDIVLNITSGKYQKVFGGNNLGGKINGSITVNVDETGCHPVSIGELYGGGNMAAYSIYGYNTDGTVKTSGTKLYDDPVVNIVSCTSIGTVYGGGLGTTATVVGDPTVNINQIPGKYAAEIDADGDGEEDEDANAIGTIGNIFGGGNAAPVQGDTYVNIGTAKGTQKHVVGDDDDDVMDLEYDEPSANIRGNVYGGGNKAKVTGDTKVVIGPAKN